MSRLFRPNRIKWLAVVIGTVIFGWPFILDAAGPLPAPTNYINDYAGVLTTDEKMALNAKLKLYEEASTNQIFVALVQDLGGRDIESYANDVFTDWRIGQKGKDNGILILASVADDVRRIEVGYGLEGRLTDGQAGTIIRQALKPNWQAKQYAQALNETIDLIEKQIGGQTDLPESRPSSDWSGWAIFLLVIVIQVTFALGRWLASSKAWWPGGVLGLGLGGLIGLWLHILTVVLLAGMALGLVGLVIDFILSRTYKPGTFVRRGGPWFWGGFGGFGGGFGGGGSGGGGASG